MNTNVEPAVDRLARLKAAYKADCDALRGTPEQALAIRFLERALAVGRICPFCQGSDLEQPHGHSIECIDCGAKGGRFELSDPWEWASPSTVDAARAAEASTERDLDES